MQDAISKCRMKVRDYFGLNNSIITEILLNSVKSKETEVEENLKESINKSKSDIDNKMKMLYGPASARQREELDKLLETVGIVPLVINDENPLSFISAQTLIKELNYLAKKYEVDTDKTVLKGK